jgi:hypothetical protein
MENLERTMETRKWLCDKRRLAHYSFLLFLIEDGFTTRDALHIWRSTSTSAQRQMESSKRRSMSLLRKEVRYHSSTSS